MSIRDNLYDLRREREAVYAKIHGAQQDLKRIRELPASSSRDVEVKRKKGEVERLEQEFGYLDGLISVMTPPGAAGV